MVALVCGFGSPARGQLQQNEYQQQQEHAARFEPAPLLAPSRTGGGPAATVRVRFYADDEYRSSSGGGRWQERVRVMLSNLNQVVEPTFGVRFEGESFRRWPRQGQSGALQPMLEQLERLDPGPDVDWVVGLVSPLPLVSMSFHDLGIARVLGRHFVLRGMSSIAELDDFKRVLPALDQQVREELYSRRKAHKELAIFLHEWAHTLGGLHVQDPTRIMGPGYSNRTSTFNVEDATLIGAGLDARMEARGREAIDWGPLRKYLTETRADWVASERETLLGQLRAMPVVSSRVPTVPIPGLGLPGRSPPPGLAGRPPESGPPGRPPNPSGAPGLPPLQPGLSGRLPPQPAARPPETGPIAEVRKLLDRGELTAATRMLAGIGPDATRALAGDLQEARRRFGLPVASKRFSLPAEAESQYATTVEDAARAMRSGKTREAQTTIERGLKAYPGAPGLLVVQCELLMRQGRPRAAAAPCADALAVMDDLPHAHYLLGCIRAEVGQVDQAITSLKRSIALERNDQKVWDALAQLYRGLGRTAEYAKFAARYGM
jgi:hypothetical protein